MEKDVGDQTTVENSVIVSLWFLYETPRDFTCPSEDGMYGSFPKSRWERVITVCVHRPPFFCELLCVDVLFCTPVPVSS